jgi:hypothetical protein
MTMEPDEQLPKQVTDEHVEAALAWIRWRQSAGSISEPHEWVNDPSDFEWEQRRPDLWVLAYGYLTHGYIGLDGHGDGGDALRAAMGLALDHALCRPVEDAWDR